MTFSLSEKADFSQQWNHPLLDLAFACYRLNVKFSQNAAWYKTYVELKLQTKRRPDGILYIIRKMFKTPFTILPFIHNWIFWWQLLGKIFKKKQHITLKFLVLRTEVRFQSTASRIRFPPGTSSRRLIVKLAMFCKGFWLLNIMK